MNIANPEYKRAFEAYLRRGTPIGLSLKQERTTTHYVWRTRGDGKVRPSHAVNNGKIFAWDDPPPTGHPGEDYGCRCTAEPYAPGIREHMTMIMSGISDAGRVWKDEWGGDFIDHYRDVLDLWNILPGDNFDWFLAQTYEITDAWYGKFSGIIQRNRDGSKYRAYLPKVGTGFGIKICAGQRIRAFK